MPQMVRRAGRRPAAGICAATSASAISTSRRSTSPDQRGVRLAGELAHRPEGHQGTRLHRLGIGYLEQLAALRRHRRISRRRASSRRSAATPNSARAAAASTSTTAITPPWVVLANAYLDLGTWWCMTPFIGAGVGGAYHTVRGLTDVGYHLGRHHRLRLCRQATTRSGTSPGRSMPASPTTSPTLQGRARLPLPEHGLRRRPRTSLCGAAGCGVGGGPRAYYTLTNIDSHDFKIGMRWMLQPEPVYPPPLMRRG